MLKHEASRLKDFENEAAALKQSLLSSEQTIRQLEKVNSEIQVRGDPRNGDNLGGFLSANVIRPSGFTMQPTVSSAQKSGASADPLAKVLQG
eukprot:9054373-Karenia_brevis.AAC.1